MDYSMLKLELVDGYATLTFNRPDKRNALSAGMVDELNAALTEVETGPARVLILTGEGTAFCAGMDLDELKALAEASAGHSILEATITKHELQRANEAHLLDSRRMARLFRRVYTFPKPIIAAVNGAAIAGGCGLATLCDFTLAVPEARFGYTEVRIGFIPALVSVFLIRQIGEKGARDLLLTGRLLRADEARSMGLVNEVVPPERLMERARELAATLLDASPTSLVYTKRLLHEFDEKELERQLEMALHENARIRSTPDFREGLSAFLEKRKPKWRE